MSKVSPGSGQDAELARALVRAQDLCARLEADRSVTARETEVAKARARELEESMAFRLGSLLLSLRSIKGIIGAPRAFADLFRHMRTRERPQRDAGPYDANSVVPAVSGIPGGDVARAWHASRRPGPPDSLSGLRVAAVVDQFTEACFAPDCELLNLEVEQAEQQLDEFQPHLLFVESAWRGKSGSWMHKVHPCSGELRRLVDACRRRAIPTVFWNKEDPSHFDNFIEAAALFDHVFTSDADCIPRYREQLDHDRVDVLAFACQPAIHNPLEEGPRAAAACFAGSWYAKYPERARDFEALVDAVEQVMPVEIYDRNHARNDPSFAYPARYQSLIKGGVSYERIAKVYKGCEFAVSVNTITDSTTMFARRVFELLACNTITISNYSLGLDRTLGDTVVMDGRDDVRKRLSQLIESEGARHRLRLQGLRQVMGRHTAAHRLARLAARTLGPVGMAEPTVWVFARASSREESSRIMAMFSAQRWQRKELLLIAPETLRRDEVPVEGVRIVDGAEMLLSLVPDCGWVSPWHPADYYGPCYLLDLMHATKYTSAPVIGKSTYFRMLAHGPELQSDAVPYHEVSGLAPRRSVAARYLVAGLKVRQVVDADSWPGEAEGLAVDEFGYCMDGAGRRDAASADV